MVSWGALIGGLLGLCLIAAWPWLRHIEADIWSVHYDACKARYDTNEALLFSPFCDKGANELAFQEKVGCAKARTENAWGIAGCTLQSRLAVNIAADGFRYALDSWSVYVFFIVVAVALVRYYMQSRAEVAKHEASIKSQERTLDRLMPALENNSKRPRLMGYQRGSHGQIEYADNRGAYYQ